ncbi:Predicted transcriptional regulator, contains HTH domain [Halobiforma haloterrestris]|uniref:Predicted transcriptional regulator, contains HTH domain n=1 Tax=Natronobacterium haloterrestre TaxID=148448 RepID=A0A1I1EB50_NATHA|nr:MarR family transcriptional regulator [Halobiforma haloterrestris]SFB83956.1 Predicted transcriptional regulator, contains HTH domain [Halobiforma haloterrestris]
MCPAIKSRVSTGSAIDDIAYLVRSEHRVPILVALAARPRSRADLRELTGASSSTVRRTLRAFEDRAWIRRTGNRYEATQLGTLVATTMEELIDRLETERALRDVWHLLPDEERGFTIEMCADATVTVAEPTDPYAPVNRFESLLQETSEFRFVGSDLALFEPCKDVFRRRIVGGMETEVVDPPDVARYILETYPDYCSALFESGNLTLLVHDELPPYGIGIFDERIAVGCYERTSGTVRVLLDTDDPAAREWAESVYGAARREARPLMAEPAK